MSGPQKHTVHNTELLREGDASSGYWGSSSRDAGGHSLRLQAFKWPHFEKHLNREKTLNKLNLNFGLSSNCYVAVDSNKAV